MVSAWRPLAGSGRDAQIKALSGFVTGRALDWPWFDDCRARFVGLGRYPDVGEWDIFDAGEPEPEPTTTDEAINWVDIDEARALLKECSIKPAGRKKSDIFNALYEHIPFDRWQPIALAAWRQAESERAEGPNSDQVEQAKIRLLVASMSAADYVAHRVEQLRSMIDDGTMSGIRIEPNGAIAQTMMHAPSPYGPHHGLPPFFPGDHSSVAGIRAEWIRSEAPIQQQSKRQIANATARGIAKEKSQESVAVFQVIGTVLLAWLVGAVTDSSLIGVGVMLMLLIFIWKNYRR
jgi:hypothetical protein